MTLGGKALLVAVALAGFGLPALPLVEIGGVAATGYQRVEVVPGLWLPAVLPGLAWELTWVAWVKSTPWTRWPNSPAMIEIGVSMPWRSR